MPNVDGRQVAEAIKAAAPNTPVILLTGEGSVEMALRAIQEEGAFHYFEKPIDFPKLRLVVERAVEFAEARRENVSLRRQLRDRGAFGELVGMSEPMRQIYVLIEQVSPSSASVLITGESGTGKELVARTIHNLSPRRNAAFVAINCSAIPETLMESELFGHERGAFTGAAARRPGCFELANGGTLLLDEISEMPFSLQAKLLRVLEDRKIRRLGGTHEQMAGKRRDVALPVAQRRDRDVDDVEPVIEVLAEAAGGDLLAEAPVGRGDDAHVDGERAGAADALDFAGLDRAQQLGLGLEREVADLVEEQRAAVGQLEPALLALHRAGERPALVAEQLALDQVLRDRRTVDLDERARGAPRERLE